MDAEGKSLEFLLEEEPLVIPFFQRPYVWNDTNWKDLIDDLLNSKAKHFIGSLIIKRIVKSGKIPAHGVIIDGQQRLTTLSILIKVLYEILFERKQLVGRLPEYARNSLFNYKNSKYTIRLSHSHLDKPKYENIIGEIVADKKDKSIITILSPERESVLKELDEEIKTNTELKAKGKKELPFQYDENNLIRSCYKYFYFRLRDKKTSELKKLFENLFQKNNNILVLIDIHDEDEEQKIFDTINSAGVALSSTDIIKNALFEALKKKGVTESNLIQYYNETWVSVFEINDAEKQFWIEKKNVGRYKRDNTELLFQSIGIIKKIYDVENDTLSGLAKKYKNYIDSLSTEKALKQFIGEIIKYAKLYRTLPVFSNSITYKWNDVRERIACICGVSENTTFMPYILYLYMKFESDEKTLISRLELLEKILIHYIISGSSNKNFNKYCSDMINQDQLGIKKLMKYITNNKNAGGVDSFTEDDLRRGLSKKSNLSAKLLLFWVEVFRNAAKEKSDKTYVGLTFAKELELEHIMPQTWNTQTSPWRKVKCIDENGNTITEPGEIEKYRNAKILSIGNMTILPKKLNSSVSNDSFEMKLKGKTTKKKHFEGIEECSSFSITTEIEPSIGKYTDSSYTWNEVIIRKREKKLADEILKIWPPLV